MKRYPIMALLFCAQLLPLHAELTDAVVRERTDYIQKRFDEGQGAAKTWWWGWLWGYTGITVAQMGLYYAIPNDSEDNKTTRDILLVGAASSLLGVIGQIITPMTPAYAGDELRALPDGTPQQRLEKLRRGESLLKESAEREEFGRSWIAHSACVVVNLGAGLIIWQGMHHSFTDGLVNFGAGMLISEIQIFTQPMQAVHDLAEYKRRYGAGTMAGSAQSANWFLQMGLTGFKAGVYF